MRVSSTKICNSAHPDNDPQTQCGNAATTLATIAPRQRGFDPTVGAWAEQDETGYVNGANLYAFAENNPLAVTDPTGGFGVRINDPGTKVDGAGGTIRLPDGETGDVAVFRDVAFTIPVGVEKNGDIIYEDLKGGIDLSLKTKDAAKASCLNAHWIQFYKATFKGLRGEDLKMVYQTGGVYHYAGDTYLDANNTGKGSAYADESALGVIHNGIELTFLDRPTPTKDKAWSESSIQLDSFLVIDKKVYWHIRWGIISGPTGQGDIWSTKLDKITGEAADSLGAFGDAAKLLVGYEHENEDTHKLSGEIMYANPLK